MWLAVLQLLRRCRDQEYRTSEPEGDARCHGSQLLRQGTSSTSIDTYLALTRSHSRSSSISIFELARRRSRRIWRLYRSHHMHAVYGMLPTRLRSRLTSNTPSIYRVLSSSIVIYPVISRDSCDLVFVGERISPQPEAFLSAACPSCWAPTSAVSGRSHGTVPVPRME